MLLRIISFNKNKGGNTFVILALSVTTTNGPTTSATSTSATSTSGTSTSGASTTATPTSGRTTGLTTTSGTVYKNSILFTILHNLLFFYNPVYFVCTLPYTCMFTMSMCINTILLFYSVYGLAGMRHNAIDRVHFTSGTED